MKGSEQMSLISQALADKKEQKRTEARLKREAVETAKAAMTFDARLQEDLANIEKLFKDSGVKRIVCTVNDSDLANVTRALYSGRLAEYKVSVDGNQVIFETEYIEL